jgi:hypothetical protein
MLTKLAALTKLRLSLQMKAAALNEDAAANPDAAAALEQLRLSAECRDLDGQIGTLASKIWKKRRHERSEN